MSEVLKQLLIIEDDAGIRKLLEIFLQNMGCFAVTFAKSLAEAESFLNDMVFDGIVADNSLPDGKGLTLLRTLAADDRHQTTPRWLFTSDRANEQEFKAAEGKIIKEYIAKPNTRRLIEALREEFLGEG